MSIIPFILSGIGLIILSFFVPDNFAIIYRALGVGITTILLLNEIAWRLSDWSDKCM